VTSYFKTGSNTLKFRAEDICSDVRRFNLKWQISLKNQPPIIGSVTTSPDRPLVVGEEVTFTVNWSDPDSGDKTKIHICKTDAITPLTQTCNGGSWCDTTSWSDSSPTSCSYTPVMGDLGTQNYFAFVCDDEDDENACSSSLGGDFEVIEYAYRVCLSSSYPTRVISCRCTRPNQNCRSEEVVLCSISDKEDATIGAPDVYPIKVCCKIRP
jgi:hypothetical protein